mgnify:FL=1
MDDSADSRHKLDHGPLIVPPGERISLGDYDPRYCEGLEGKSEGRKALLEDKSDLAAAQTLLWANSKRSVLIILQALDAAGKDGAIKHVIPADRKWFARAAIADIITWRIGALNLQPPELSEEQREDLTKARQELGI